MVAVVEERQAKSSSNQPLECGIHADNLCVALQEDTPAGARLQPGSRGQAISIWFYATRRKAQLRRSGKAMPKVQIMQLGGRCMLLTFEAIARVGACRAIACRGQRRLIVDPQVK